MVFGIAVHKARAKAAFVHFCPMYMTDEARLAFFFCSLRSPSRFRLKRRSVGCDAFPSALNSFVWVHLSGVGAGCIRNHGPKYPEPANMTRVGGWGLGRVPFCFCCAKMFLRRCRRGCRGKVYIWPMSTALENPLSHYIFFYTQRLRRATFPRMGII